jgi:hypothetical protein
MSGVERWGSSRADRVRRSVWLSDSGLVCRAVLDTAAGARSLMSSAGVRRGSVSAL